jgi:hypothetical protein
MFEGRGRLLLHNKKFKEQVSNAPALAKPQVVRCSQRRNLLTPKDFSKRGPQFCSWHRGCLWQDPTIECSLVLCHTNRLKKSSYS